MPGRRETGRRAKLTIISAKLCDRVVRRGFIALELLRARLARTPKQRILFSDVKQSRSALERSFRRTRHEIHFGSFESETVRDFDLLVPLKIEDVRRLDAMRELVPHASPPISSRSAIEVCDDKLAFHEKMVSIGLGDVVPRVGDDIPPPYVLKGRRGVGGFNTYVVHRHGEAIDLPANAKPNDYFRQELVPGRYEYTAHILFIDGRIRRALCIEHDMERDISVKGPLWPRRQRIVRSRYLPLFARILAAVEFEGLCNIDFKIRNGKPVVMEVNPRMGGSLCPYVFAFVRTLARMKR